MASAQLTPQMAHSSSFFDSEEVSRSCSDSIERMELVAELLLLRSGSRYRALYPVSRAGDSYTMSRDAIVANTKALAISIKDLTKELKEKNMPQVDNTVRYIADKVVILTEAAAHAAYLSAMCDIGSVGARTGVVDQYSLAKARQRVVLACLRFSLDRAPLTKKQILELTQTMATSLTVLRQNCKAASESEQISVSDRNQFVSCVQAMDGVSSCFVTSVKAYGAETSAENRSKVAIFVPSLIAVVNSITGYGCLARFSGQPAELAPKGESSQTEILAGAMSVVSAAVQLLNAASTLVENLQTSPSNKDKGIADERQWQKLVSCARAVADSCKMLASSIRHHTPSSSPQLSRGHH